jgi:cobyrinic acid a,c-diamide synthase
LSLESQRIWGKARTMQGTCCKTSRAAKKKGVEKFYPDFLLHSPFKNQISQSLGTALHQSQISPIFRLPLDCYIQRQDVTNCSCASRRLGLKGLQEGINARTIIRIRYIARKVQKHLDQVITLCRICRYC